MTARLPIEFTDVHHKCAGNIIQIESGDGIAISASNPLPFSPSPAIPSRFIYKFLSRVSGPQAASTNDVDLNTASSLATPSVFEYQASGRVRIRRINFEMVDSGIQNQRFAGLAGLANGCLLEVVDDDGATQILDFLDGNPIIMNGDFAPLSGVDSVPFTVGAGDDAMPVRFTIGKAGAAMLLTNSQIIRWTNQDDLSAITRFRGMVQGVAE